jgi:ABC-2 type transport system permease protein
MSETILKNIHTDVKITTFKTDENGDEKKSLTEVTMIVGLVASILIYMFIFMFGTQVMRGVIEEKTNRIIEVIVSSVKPFQLMAGKIIGVALVGLTQFLLWVVFTFLIITAIQATFPDMFKPQQIEQAKISGTHVALPNETSPVSPNAISASTGNEQINQVFDAFSAINIKVMVVAFIFYFLFGYLLYGALFAAIGSAVDNETDTQQFIIPITIPLILSIVVAQTIIQNPDSPLAFWMSMIPFTSPVIMMVRLPFGVPGWEVVVSILLLIAGFLFTTWLAAKIYRTGILMYGKKSDYKELWKWIRYKN